MLRANLNCFETDPDRLLLRFVTIDEKWVYNLTPKSKQQSKQWKHPGSLQSKNAKTVPFLFWEGYGIVFFFVFCCCFFFLCVVFFFFFFFFFLVFYGRLSPKGADTQHIMLHFLGFKRQY